MYQRIISGRILLSVGVGLLIFSLVFGWVAFSVPDWLQFYERNGVRNASQADTNFNDLKKFGLWYKCIFSLTSNDFACTLWNNDAPSFVRVAQVLVSFALGWGCLAFILACSAFMCRQSFVHAVLFSALFAFLSFIFMTIAVTVFATESIVYVDRLRIDNNTNPRRWGMWLLLPNLILSFLTSICFIIASLFHWCDYRSMQVTGILSHSADKYNGSVCKVPSDSNMTTVMKKQFQYHDYPNACYQINGINNNQPQQQQQQQQPPIGYPPPPNYGGAVNQAYPSTPPGQFGYSRSGSPTINPMYPHTNYDPYYPRHYMTENSEIDGSSRMSRSHRPSRSDRRSRHRSRSLSPRESYSAPDNNPKQTQYIPIPVPYYQPQAQPTPSSTAAAPANNNPNPVSYIFPQNKQQYALDNNQSAVKTTNIIKYGVGQPSVLMSNPTQPVYTIAYRANNGGNVLQPSVLTGPPATTYVTAVRNQMDDILSESDTDERVYQTVSKQRTAKKININEAWAWRKVH